MKKQSPTMLISESRVYFLVCQLRKRELSGNDAQAYSDICKVWNKFMAGPNSLPGVALPEDLYQPLRVLESMCYRGPNMGLLASVDAPGRGLQQPIGDEVRRANSSKGKTERKPHGYWESRALEIAKKYDGGMKVPALRDEYGTSQQMIYYCITRGRAQRASTPA